MVIGYFYYCVFNICIFMVGATFASAVTCAVYRRVHGLSWATGRSKCEHCGHVLKWYELIPVVSCLALGGRCKVCHNSFGLYHAAIECAFGIYTLLLFMPGCHLLLPIKVLLCCLGLCALALLAYAHYAAK